MIKTFALLITAVTTLGNSYNIDDSHIKNKIKPVIIYPEDNSKVYSEDSLALRYYAQEGKDCYIILSDEKGTVDVTKIKSGSVFHNSVNNNMHRVGRGGVYLIDEELLAPEKKYSIQIVSDFKTSDPVYFSTFTGGEEVIKQILNKNRYNKKLKLSIESVAPKEYFSSSKLARQMMETININIWKIDSRGNKYQTTTKLTVNKNIKNNYINAFNELFAIGFPINSVGCYNYRNTHGGRLSEHALGTAVDINPTQNYCRYSDGTTVGKLWEPYKNIYSVTPEVVSIFKKYGFGWGGDWGDTPDYMHFSYFET